MNIVSLLQPLPKASESVDASFPHVLIVVDGLAGPMGGGERIALKLASLLPTYGYRVSILTFQAPTDAAVVADPPCPIYLLPITNAFSLSALRATFQMRRFLREQRVEIVQTFFESSDLWAGLTTKCMSSARLIWSRRDMGILRKRKHRLAYRLLCRLPDRVFAVSELVRRHCIDIDGIDQRRVQTIYNGLELEDWKASPQDRPQSNSPLITSVGNIRRVKGHDLFVRAAARVIKRYPRARFSVAGSVLEPAYFAELQRLVQELGLTQAFHFAGGVRDLRTHFASADIFVLPSRSEGFSNAIVEAMAMTLPVVATAVGGNAEAVVDGVSGIIVPPEDPDALAQGILSLLDDEAAARRMGEEGRRIVAATFTTASMMTRVTRTYEELLGSDVSPRASSGQVLRRSSRGDGASAAHPPDPQTLNV